MRIKKGDNVLVISGKDKGKKGKVSHCLPNENKIIVEGVNILIRHTRARRQGEKGQKVELAAPISISNVKLVCPKCGRPTRVSSKISSDKAKNRVCKKCKQIISKA